MRKDYEIMHGQSLNNDTMYVLQIEKYGQLTKKIQLSLLFLGYNHRSQTKNGSVGKMNCFSV